MVLGESESASKFDFENFHCSTYKTWKFFKSRHFFHLLSVKNTQTGRPQRSRPQVSASCVHRRSSTLLRQRADTRTLCQTFKTKKGKVLDTRRERRWDKKSATLEWVGNSEHRLQLRIVDHVVKWVLISRSEIGNEDFRTLKMTTVPAGLAMTVPRWFEKKSWIILEGRSSLSRMSRRQSKRQTCTWHWNVTLIGLFESNKPRALQFPYVLQWEVRKLD